MLGHRSRKPKIMGSNHIHAYKGIYDRKRSAVYLHLGVDKSVSCSAV